WTAAASTAQRERGGKLVPAVARVPLGVLIPSVPFSSCSTHRTEARWPVCPDLTCRTFRISRAAHEARPERTYTDLVGGSTSSGTLRPTSANAECWSNPLLVTRSRCA